MAKYQSLANKQKQKGTVTIKNQENNTNSDPMANIGVIAIYPIFFTGKSKRT